MDIFEAVLNFDANVFVTANWKLIQSEQAVSPNYKAEELWMIVTTWFLRFFNTWYGFVRLNRMKSCILLKKLFLPSCGGFAWQNCFCACDLKRYGHESFTLKMRGEVKLVNPFRPKLYEMLIILVFTRFPLPTLYLVSKSVLRLTLTRNVVQRNILQDVSSTLPSQYVASVIFLLL